VRRSLIIEVVVRIVFHSALVLSLFLLFAGHNQPGGGFIGGLVAGAAFALRYASGGIDAVRQGMRLRPWTLLGVGVMTITATALVPLAFGNAALQSEIYKFHLGPLGDTKLTTPLFFDAGVYLVVVGMVLMLFEAFGETMLDGDAT
jgi:multisubunit Na+/H+ antiporter MnhB subunit